MRTAASACDVISNIKVRGKRIREAWKRRPEIRSLGLANRVAAS